MPGYKFSHHLELLDAWIVTKASFNQENKLYQSWKVLGCGKGNLLLLCIGPQLGVMIWGVIFFNSPDLSSCHFWHTDSQDLRCRHFQPVMLPFLLQTLDFQNDNFWLHTARIAMNCRQACPMLPWSAWQLYLFLIEHIWDIMRRWLQPFPNIDDLVQQLEPFFYEILQDTIK